MDRLPRNIFSMLTDGKWQYGTEAAVDAWVGRYYERYADHGKKSSESTRRQAASSRQVISGLPGPIGHAHVSVGGARCPVGPLAAVKR